MFSIAVLLFTRDQRFRVLVFLSSCVLFLDFHIMYVFLRKLLLGLAACNKQVSDSVQPVVTPNKALWIVMCRLWPDNTWFSTTPWERLWSHPRCPVSADSDCSNWQPEQSAYLIITSLPENNSVVKCWMRLGYRSHCVYEPLRQVQHRHKLWNIELQN